MSRLSPSTFSRGVEEVSRERGVPTQDILTGVGRRGAVGEARQYLMWRLKRDGYSLLEIARVFGLDDHSTVHHGVRAHAKRLAAEMTREEYAEAVQELAEDIAEAARW